jgi:hypothetical protein
MAVRTSIGGYFYLPHRHQIMSSNSHEKMYTIEIDVFEFAQDLCFCAAIDQHDPQFKYQIVRFSACHFEARGVLNAARAPLSS